jgi:hypothetical protein
MGFAAGSVSFDQNSGDPPLLWFVNSAAHLASGLGQVTGCTRWFDAGTPAAVAT